MDSAPPHDVASRLLAPSQLFTRDEVLPRLSPIPAASGMYAWYFDEVPSRVPLAGCRTTGSNTLLYVGISPSRPPANGRPASRQTLRTRVRYHYRGNAYGSTLRLTLGTLLAAELGIELRLVGSGSRLTFNSGEAVLSEWMGLHARVCWIEHATPWDLEHQLIKEVALPLNLDQNNHSPFRRELSAMRGEQRARARSLPVLAS